MVCVLNQFFFLLSPFAYTFLLPAPSLSLSLLASALTIRPLSRGEEQKGGNGDTGFSPERLFHEQGAGSQGRGKQSSE